MADWTFLLPQANRVQPLMLQDVYDPNGQLRNTLAVASFLDKRDNARIRNKLISMQLQDQFEERQATLDIANKLNSRSTGNMLGPGAMPNGGAMSAHTPQGSTSPGQGPAPATRPSPKFTNVGQVRAQRASANPDIALGKEKLVPIMGLVKEAIEAGDKGALQHLFAAVRADPHMSKLFPKDFSMNVSGAGQVEIVQTMDMRQLRELGSKVKDPLVRQWIMQATPGQAYEYTLKNGKVTEFKPAAVRKETATLPGPRTPSREHARKRPDAFERVLDRSSKGTPGVRLKGMPTSEQSGDGNVVPRKPGESVADYLKRTGG
jgi:hypothetical protein